LDRDIKHPLGFKKMQVSRNHSETYVQEPPAQGPYYCGVGSNAAFKRKFVLDVYEKCLKAGLKISGMNGEVAPGKYILKM
jgi:glutamine synthetase